jgi:hypothetical protein
MSPLDMRLGSADPTFLCWNATAVFTLEIGNLTKNTCPNGFDMYKIEACEFPRQLGIGSLSVGGGDVVLDSKSNGTCSAVPMSTTVWQKPQAG